MIIADTDVLIAHLRGLAPAVDWLEETRQTEGQLATSVVTLIEITGGMRSSERSDVWRLLSSLRIEPADEVVARRAGEFMRRYRRSHASIGLSDYTIAATADVRGLELKTLNVKHFPMLPKLRPAFRL